MGGMTPGYGAPTPGYYGQAMTPFQSMPAMYGAAANIAMRQAGVNAFSMSARGPGRPTLSGPASTQKSPRAHGYGQPRHNSTGSVRNVYGAPAAETQMTVWQQVRCVQAAARRRECARRVGAEVGSQR